MESQPVQSLIPALVAPVIRRKGKWAASFMAALVVGGLALTQSPSLRGAIGVVEGGAARVAEAILAARSPGDRPNSTLLTKVKKALGSNYEVSDDDSLTKPRLVTRSRIIPPRKAQDASEPELVPVDVAALLAPLESLGDTASTLQPELSPFPAAFPVIPLGDTGGSGGFAGGSQGGGGGTPIGEVPPGITPGTSVTPSAVPEPSTWLSMIVGLAFVGAALRRRLRVTAFAI